MNPSAKGMKFATVWRIAALTVLLGLPSSGWGDTTPLRDYDVKAAFLYNFSAFTEWPATAFAASTSPIVIGIVGKDPFGFALDRMMQGERVKDRPLMVWRIARIEDVARCHILFICGSESKHLGDILDRLKLAPVLTVSDIPGFAESGGAVGFITTSSVQLKINPAAVHTAHLTLSAKLLRLAQLVGKEGAAR